MLISEPVGKNEYKSAEFQCEEPGEGGGQHNITSGAGEQINEFGWLKKKAGGGELSVVGQMTDVPQTNLKHFRCFFALFNGSPLFSMTFSAHGGETGHHGAHRVRLALPESRRAG